MSNLPKIFPEKAKDKIERLLTEMDELLNKGQFPKAQELMKEIEIVPILSMKNKLRIILSKIKLLRFTEDFEEGIRIANEAYSSSIELGEFYLSLKIGIELANILDRMGDFQSSMDLLEDLEILNQSHFQSNQCIFQQFLSDILLVRTTILWHIGDLKQALYSILKSIEIRKKFSSDLEIANAIALGGMIYCEMGDIINGINFLKESLVLQQELHNIHYLGILYNNLGWVFRLQGDLIKAKHYLEESIKIRKDLGADINFRIEFANLGVILHQMGKFQEAERNLQQALLLGKKVGNPVEIAIFLYYIIHLMLDQNRISDVKKFIDELQILSEKTGNEKIHQRFLLCYALYLKKNPRIKNVYRAQNIFREIAHDAIVKHELTVEALINLCDLLIFELKISNDPEILDEINSSISNLLSIAKEIRSYYLWAEINFLKAKLALMNFDIVKARKMFSQAQMLAQEQGLSQLAIKISNEHDYLLEQEQIWEQFKSHPPKYDQRLELARLHENLERIKRQGIIENSPVLPEEPIMIVIMNENGPTLFSHSFGRELKFNEQLFGGILAAFESFSTEIFNGMLERAKFGEYKILLKTISPFLICYIYKGQSYFAQQNFIQLLELIQKSKHIWNLLIEAIENGNLVSTHRIPQLVEEIEKIFNGIMN
ncbi:tetratricopeptide repeat protein [Candidatus Harpocratesius sp.]